jgi:hypothetical protein
MLRFLARTVGYWIVAAALVAAVVDGARSIADSALILTPISESWASIAAFAGWEAAAADLAAYIVWPLDIAYMWLLAAPTAIVLAIIGVLLLLAGAKRRRPSIGREFMA